MVEELTKAKDIMKFIYNFLPSNIQHYIKRILYIKIYHDFFMNQQKKRRIITEEGYSYKPFDDYKCIFIHIPKCAGVSICRSLFGNLAGGHNTICDYQIVFSLSEFRNYFKFAFVRNPWDRLVSAFYFLKNGGLNDSDKFWANIHLREYNDFNIFVQKWINEKNIWNYYHFRPQYNYFCIKNFKPEVDFIGYYENIKSDFNYVCRKIGINANIANYNKSKRPDYREIYDKNSIEIVADVYAKDIEILGYTFDNSLYQKKNISFK